MGRLLQAQLMRKQRGHITRRAILGQGWYFSLEGVSIRAAACGEAPIAGI
jgi:hypothetical protein